MADILNTIHVSIMVNNQQIQNQINPVVISGETPCITPYTRPIINQNNNEKETKSQKKIKNHYCNCKCFGSDNCDTFCFFCCIECSVGCLVGSLRLLFR